MSNEFQWTDELVWEFFRKHFFESNAVNSAKSALEQFKASKEPKKEWEVVDFQVHKDSKLLYTLREDGRYRADGHQQRDGFSLDKMLQESEIIHSVRRLPDNTTWTVDEKVEVWETGRFIIKGFEIRDNQMCAKTDGGTYLLNALMKLPAPLFTTLDGVEINPANPNRIYPVDKDFGYMVTTLTEYNKDAWGNHRVFSTREAAETYILENRALLSIKDLRELLIHCVGLDLTNEIVGFATNLVKSKL